MLAKLAPLAAALLLVSVSGCLSGHSPRQPTIGDVSFSTTSVFPGTYDKSGAWSRVATPGTLGILEPKVETLASAYDGVDLILEYVRPDTTEKAPVIVVATPYLTDLTPAGMKTEAYYDQLVPNYVPHGYAVAFIPVRGTSNQGGCMDLFGKAERADLDQAVTWLAEQDWSNGNVAVTGVSYDGSTPWELAAMGNPHVKTIVPMSGVNDVWSLSYHNGSVQWFGEGGLVADYYAYTATGMGLDEGSRTPAHSAEGATCPSSWQGIAASAYAHETLSRDDPFGYFAERNLRQMVVDNYHGSVFWVHGLRDFRVDPLQGYEMVKILERERPDMPVKVLLGQWDHGWPDAVAYHPEAIHEYARWDWAEIQLRWFDHELKGDLSVDVGPRVQVQDNLRSWRDEAQWPPKDAEPTRFYLGPTGDLSTSGTGGSQDLLVGPNPGDDSLQYLLKLVGNVDVPVVDAPCPDCPSFETPPFDHEVRFAGVPDLQVIATPTGPGGHIAAFLYLVQDGHASRIGRGQVDLRLGDGGDVPKAVVPNAPRMVHVQFEPLDAVVPEGASLRLVLTQGAFEERLPSIPTYPVRVTAGGTGGPGAESSSLTLLTFERDAGDLFTPP